MNGQLPHYEVSADQLDRPLTGAEFSQGYVRTLELKDAAFRAGDLATSEWLSEVADRTAASHPALLHEHYETVRAGL